MNICVHTSLSWRGEAEPHVFFVGGNRLIVAAILQRWSEHANRFYEVRCDDGRRFVLRYDIGRQSWELAGVYARAIRQPSLPSLQWRRWWSTLRRA